MRIIFLSALALFLMAAASLFFAGFATAEASPAGDDLPPLGDIDYRCEAPAFTDFTDKVPSQPGEANAYTISLPEDVVACHVDFYPTENTVPVSIAAPMAVTTCHPDGYCAKGLGTFKEYTDGEFSFWWEETKPVWVRVYFRLLIPGESAPTLTPTPGGEFSPAPTPEPTPAPTSWVPTATPTAIVGPAPNPKPWRAYLPVVVSGD